MIITAAWLQRHKACLTQVETFSHEWPGGAELNGANIRRARDLHLDLDWLAHMVLKGPARREYKRTTALAWAEYKRTTALAWAKYERATAPALAEYQRATAPALAEHERVKDLAWAEYKRATAPAWAEYQRATAPALISALALAEVE